MKSAAILLFTLLVSVVAAQSQTAPPAPTFRLYFLGHEVGGESSPTATTHEFRFVERGTEVKLSGSLELDSDGAPVHFKVQGRNYRLFASDSEVAIANGRA